MVESSWPGDREPTATDLPCANELPGRLFLAQFRDALLQSPDARRCPRPSHTWPVAPQTNCPPFTYPLRVLTDFPPLPAPSELAETRRCFHCTFHEHPYVHAMQLSTDEKTSLPPPLVLAFSSLGHCFRRRDRDLAVAAQLFLAGCKLWVVIVESDNRQSRLIQNVVAMALLTTYGAMTSNRLTWTTTESHLGHIFTMSRTLGLHNSCASGNMLRGDEETGKISCIVSYLLMLDVVHAVHTGSPTHISTAELCIRMPSSLCSFAHTYSRLNDNTEDKMNIGTNMEDALLLLLGLLCDFIYVERSFEILSPNTYNIGQTCSRTEAPRSYIPLSPDMEFLLLRDKTSLALQSWHSIFSSTAPPELLALFYYCKLRLSCANLQALPAKAAYTTLNGGSGKDVSVELAEDSVQLAWQVLDHVSLRARSVPARTAIWLPVVVFHASLVVWQGLLSNTTGSLRMLEPFSSELQSMPWPCCVEMVAILSKLGAHPSL